MQIILKMIVLLSPALLMALPSAPTNLQLKPLSSKSVKISWQSNTNDNNGYKIFRDGIFIRRIYDSNIHTYIDTGLQGNTQYRYTVKATDDGSLQTFQTRITNGNDDMEEHTNGDVTIGSSDLELTQERDQQIIGIRFTNIQIPKDAKITSAYIQFQTDERSTGSASLFIQAEDTSNALPLLATNHQLSNKSKTALSVSWSPTDWNIEGEQGINQRTSDIKSLVQFLITKPNWRSNNAITFIISGTGKRVAESYNGTPTAAPLLHIEYTTNENPPTKDTTAPIVTLNGSSSLTLTVGDVYTELGAKATDNIDGDISADISKSGSVDTSRAGTYTITYSVSDQAGNTASKKRTVRVNDDVIVKPEKDTTAPVITLNGSSSLTLTVGDVYTELGAKATDNIDGDISADISKSGSVDTSRAGTYTITYSVSDQAGNTASKKRTIHVNDAVVIPNNSGIIINEVLAANTHTNLDKDFYEASDWIELYNTKSTSVDIGGFYLSDNEDAKQWKIPNGTRISAKSYLLIWADGENKKAKELHTNFKLSTKKETLTLADKSGTIIDTISYKKLKSDISVKRVGSGLVYMFPTPKSKNSQAYTTLDLSKKPTFSIEGGFYNNTQTVTLAQENGATIYYTTDGSIPTRSSSRYTSAINITKTTVLRAKAEENGKLLSEDSTYTYFINHDTSIPVVSLSMNAAYLYDDMIGIYVAGSNGKPLHCGHVSGDYNYGQDWERVANVEYFDEDGEQAFNIGAGISISGECSRKYPKKSLAFELDKKYGVKKLEYQLYGQKVNQTTKDFKLRTGGSGFMITDILAASIVAESDLDIDYQAFKIVQMYMNGEYWGVYHIREKKGKDYIESNYPDIDGGNIDIISVGSVKAGDITDYNALRKFVNTHDLSVDANYQEVLKRIDMDNYIDYMSFMIFCGAQDWIYNNTRLWKVKTENGKWRWILDDVDGSFISWRLNSNNFNFLKERSNRFTSELFLALSKNKTFKNRFKKRLNELLDSIFTPESIMKHVDRIVNKEQSYMHLEKWAKELSQKEKTTEGFVNRFNSHIDSVREFAHKRRDIIKDQLKDY